MTNDPAPVSSCFFKVLMMPVLTDGRTSWDEALFGIVPGAVVLTVSFVIFTAGLIMVLVQRKKRLRPQ